MLASGGGRRRHSMVKRGGRREACEGAWRARSEDARARGQRTRAQPEARARGRACVCRVMERHHGRSVGFESVRFESTEKGYTCVTLGDGHEGTTPSVLLLLSFLNFREETRTKQARGGVACSASKGHTCEPLSNPTDQTRPTEQKADRLRVLQARPRPACCPRVRPACCPRGLGLRTARLL